VTGRQLFFSCALILLLALVSTLPTSFAQLQTEDVVLYASQAPVKVGNWTVVSDSTAAGGFRLTNPDAGVPKILTPKASPSHYFELNFSAQAGMAYHLWIRGKAQGDSPYNDSVYAQFSGSVNSVGTPVYRIGTTSAADINLEDCSGCGLQGWGWQDNGWGVAVLGPPLYFQTTGSQTIRIQTREDGLSIDQIVLSPTTYLINSPGGLRNDTVILPATPTPGTNVVMDSSSWPNYTEAGGGWQQWNGGGHNGNQRYHDAGSGSATATFQLTGLAGADYQVSTTWIEGSTEASSATWRIYDGATLKATVMVDNRQAPVGPTINGRPFQTLATVNIASGTLRVVASETPTGQVAVDAVHVVSAGGPPPTPTPGPGTDVVMDSSSWPNYTEAGGGWAQFDGGGYNGNQRYHDAGSGSATATFQLPGLAGGDYQVAATWVEGSTEASSATWRIYDGATLKATVVVNNTQAPVGPTINGRPFQTLATVNIASGTLRVVGSESPTGQVAVDAVHVVSAGGPQPTPTPTPLPASDIVIWASNVALSSVYGNWVREFNSTAAGQVALRNPDYGAAKLSAPLASPSNYFETSFNAVAGSPYRLWIRGRASNDFWGNDSVFVQFSGSLNSGGTASYRIGTTSGLEVNLEDCSGCGLQGWGWQDNGWGIGVLGPAVYFQTTGPQTLRVQTREDGLSIDQIVLSPTTYLNSSPGALRNDTVILPSTVAPPPVNQPPQVSISATPTSGNSPLLVSFSSNAFDPDGSIVNYNWSFGNGSISSAINPTCTYQSAGNYTATLTVTDNAGATATAAVSINVTSPPPPPTTTQLRVLSWNIAFGKGTDGIINYDRSATWIANINPDLVALCEMPPDKVSTLVSLLNQKTGRSWYSHFVPKYPGCLEGNLILSKYSFVSVGSQYLSNERSVARATVNVGGRNINFFATHLDHTSSSIRYAQVGELTSWASGFAEPRIVAGDFNAGPDLSETIRMAGSYYDGWNETMNAGTAVAYPDNPIGMHTRTRRGRIDYVWYSRGSTSLVALGTQIPDSRDLNNPNVVITLGTLDDRGVRPSDHNHMIANFEVR
jgi:endonuclease/exonuclease/phosphatase family metal-dependent hydrolase